MKYGVCVLSVVPCRLEATDTSEMVTQLLFGELYQVLDERKKWVKIRGVHDGYEAWIDRKQHFELKRDTFMKIKKASRVFTNDLISLMQLPNDNSAFPVVLGSVLPNYSNNHVRLGELDFEYIGDEFVRSGVSRRTILDTAFLYLNSPYLWGGRTPFGIDCSGYSQMVYRMAGIDLPRDASQQAEMGERLSFIEESLPGDLAFFDNTEGKITHVGILLDNKRIIHASGRVRIDRIDHQGIYNIEMRGYSHHLRLINRVIKP